MVARIVLTAACALALGGCGSTYGYDLDGLAVAAGFYPLAWAAEEIGSERTDVLNVTPLGAEPHDVELPARVVEAVRSANFVFLLRGFQPALDDAAEGADEARVVDLLPVASPVEVDGQLDPHVWLDPIRFVEVVRTIGEALERPAAAERLVTRLRGLDREYRDGLGDCERRELVTSHDAFGYLARRYGLRTVAVTGLSPEAEPSARDLERVVDEVRRHGATTVFVEKLVSPRLGETVAREVGADTAVLDPIEGVTEEEAERGEDYFSLMRANLAALREGLGCR